MKTHAFFPLLVAIALVITVAPPVLSTTAAGSTTTATGSILTPLLGKPFGEKVTITGKAPERAIMMANPISVTSIDGKLLDKPLLIEVQGAKITTGAAYTLVGYESGSFGSTPDWAACGTPVQQPFQFYHWFVVVQVEEPKGK